MIAIDWKNGKYYSLCEIFGYTNKNYVPGSTITSCFQNKDSKSVADNYHSSNNKFYA